MKYLKYIFFSLILLFNHNNVYASNSYIIVNNNFEDIENALKSNNDVTISLEQESDELVVNRRVLDLIKNKDKTLTYNIKYNNEIIYSYKFNGKYFNKSYNNINLKLYFSSDYDEFINNEFNTKKKIIVNTIYKGMYPSGTILSVKNNMGIKKGYLYSVDKNNLSKINIVNIKDNYINLNIRNGSIYVISDKELVDMYTIKMYIFILILFILELIIFIYIIFLKKDIDIPKLKNK